MLALSDYPIDEAAAKFASFGIEASYLVPTETGLKKSIMDAHAGLRDFLARNRIHDFSTQLQGPQSKVLIPVQVILEGKSVLREMSLYRPVTKNGDPRVWISGLKEFTKSGNLLALFLDRTGHLCLVNCSQDRVFGRRGTSLASSGTSWDAVEESLASVAETSPLSTILEEATTGPTAELLVSKLRAVAAHGWVSSMRNGDTGVGYTLETLLGIAANSRRSPDFHGIEIKSGRNVESRGSTQTLFTKTPDWKRSAMSASELLDRFGYLDANGRHSLYVTVTHRPNRQQLFLRVDDQDLTLENLAGDPENVTEPVTMWPMESLRERLREKHTESMWVHADRRHVNEVEQFHYRTATYTKGPLVGNLAILLRSGKLKLDYTLHRKPNGGIRDHGYLFRMERNDLPLLFPRAVEFDLVSTGDSLTE